MLMPGYAKLQALPLRALFQVKCFFGSFPYFSNISLDQFIAM